MDQPFDLIKDINGSKEIWKIANKVHHKWKVLSTTKKHFELTVIDKEVGFHCRFLFRVHVLLLLRIYC